MSSSEPATAFEPERSRLLEAGFELVSKRGPEGFGNRLVELTRGALRVMLERDRGETALSVSTLSGITSPDLGLWLSCMDHERPSLEPRDFEADVALLIRRLPEFESFITASGPETEECLREAGLWRFSQRRSLGLIKFPGQAPDLGARDLRQRRPPHAGFAPRA